MTRPPLDALGEHVESVQLIDHHVHGFWLESGNRTRFENGLNEANTEPIADFDSGFDTQLGFAVRAHCAPLLGLERHVDADTYWAHRSGYDGLVLARTFLTAAGVSDWLVDTGFSSGIAQPTLVSEVSGACAHEVLRLETLAQDAARSDGDYAASFEELLHTRGAEAIATKSILAYRGGFVGDLSKPSAASVHEAAARWRDEGGTRLTDRVLIRFGLHQALRLGKPLQFHVGFGDRDCDLATANPLHLRDFLCTAGDVPVMLLHCYPFEREAGYLAQAFNNVYLDGGLTITSAREPGASSAGCSSWRRFARFSTPRTGSGRQSCTTSVRACGATVFAMSWAASSVPTSGRSTTPSE